MRVLRGPLCPQVATLAATPDLPIDEEDLLFRSICGPHSGRALIGDVLADRATDVANIAALFNCCGACSLR